MRTPTVLATILLLVGTAGAEPAEVNEDGRLHAEPGERARVVGKVKKGQEVEILESDGRWQKIKVNGKVGWIARSKLTPFETRNPDDRITRRKPFAEGRSTRRGWGGATSGERVGADAVDGAEPEEAEPEEADPDDGDRPRRRRDRDREAPDDPEATDASDTGDELESESGTAAGRPRQWQLGAQLGARRLSQSLTSEGGTQIPDSYSLDTDSLALALSGRATWRMGQAWQVGGDLRFGYASATSGVTFMDVTAGIATTDVDVRAVALRRLAGPRALTVGARLGYHYHFFKVDGVEDPLLNPALLPSEVRQGPVLGAELTVGKLTRRIGVRASLDVLVAGAVRQTRGLEDGTSPSAKGAWLTLEVVVPWRHRLAFTGGYAGTFMWLNFGDEMTTSLRAHANAARSDQSHGLLFGVTRDL